MAISTNARAYSVGKYGMELDGVNAGWLSEVEGGHASAEVVTEKIGADHLHKKHLATVKYEDVSVKCGAGMSDGFYDWINHGFTQTFNQANGGRKNGAIIQADYDNKEITRLDFFQAILTEFSMPALDAASKDAAKMSIKFAPEYTRRKMGQNGKAKSTFNAAVTKKWNPSNFRLRIDGCEEACKKVNKIEALTIKQKVTEDPSGELRDYPKEATSVEIPNLVITLPEAYAKELYDWHESFVILGKNTEDKERGGHLDYLSSDLTETLFTLTFSHVGIFKISPDKVEAGGEGIRRVKAEFYVENITYNFASGNSAGKGA